MAYKFLSNTAWNAFATKRKDREFDGLAKATGVPKAISDYLKLGEDAEPKSRTDALDDVDDAGRKLVMSLRSDKEVADFVAGLAKDVRAERKLHDKAAAASTAADSADDAFFDALDTACMKWAKQVEEQTWEFKNKTDTATNELTNAIVKLQTSKGQARDLSKAADAKEIVKRATDYLRGWASLSLDKLDVDANGKVSAKAAAYYPGRKTI